MDFNENTVKKYAKKSLVESNVPEKPEIKTIETNIEAMAKGTFPKELLEHFKVPAIEMKESIINEIEEEHARILSQRPLPDLLENVNLISKYINVEAPKMGTLYEQKKKPKEESSKK